MYLEMGKSYIEKGVAIIDNVDREIPYTIISNTINITIIGTYKVIYKAEDSSGNIVQATRVVNVQKKSLNL